MTTTSKTARIYLVRHGATVENASNRMQGSGLDPQLSDIGAKQANDLSKVLIGTTPFVLYTSPLMRAKQTAEAIKKHVSTEINIDPGLTEMAFGKWEGLTSSEAAAVSKDALERWKRINVDSDAGPPNGETLRQVSIRAEKTLNQLVERHPNTTIVIVSHVYFIKAILEQAQRLVPGALANTLFLDPASISLIEWSTDTNSKPHVVRRVNWTCEITQGHERWK